MNKLLERAIDEVRALPEDQQEAVAERILDEVGRRAGARGGKWARVAEELAGLDLLRGRSGDFERHVREFRDTFDLRGPPDA